MPPPQDILDLIAGFARNKQAVSRGINIIAKEIKIVEDATASK